MKPQTPDKAASRYCPFTFSDQRAASTCLAGRCMAWHIVHEKVQREDHSGARDVINDYGLQTNRIPRREGGPMSSGFWILDEVGICLRLTQAPDAKSKR